MGKVRQFIGNIRGPKGTTYTPHLSQDKDLSFTNDGGLSRATAFKKVVILNKICLFFIEKVQMFPPDCRDA